MTTKPTKRDAAVPLPRPCPFCGSTNIDVDGDAMACLDCGARGPSIKNASANAAFMLWNSTNLFLQE